MTKATAQRVCSLPHAITNMCIPSSLHMSTDGAAATVK